MAGPASCVLLSVNFERNRHRLTATEICQNFGGYDPRQERTADEEIVDAVAVRR